MADTPEKDIEKLLSDYAKRRRDAAGNPELHPATRQMLQAEVKQQFGSAGLTATPKRSPWSSFFPRIATACGVMAAIVVLIVIVNPPGKGPAEMEIASVDETKSTVAEPAPPAPMRLAPAPRLAGDDLSGDSAHAKLAEAPANGLADEWAIPASRAIPTSAAAPPPSPANAEIRREATSLFAFKGGAESTEEGLTLGSDMNKPKALQGGQAPVQALAAGTSLDSSPAQIRSDSSVISLKMMKTSPAMQSAPKDLFINSAMTQRYRNVSYKEAVKPSSRQIVLNEFTVEQNGNALKVVDGDGSVYKGYVEFAPVDMVVSTNLGVIASNYVQQTLAYGSQMAPTTSHEPKATSGEVQVPTQARHADGFAAVQEQNANLGQNYYFRVEGTNRSLKERVVFTGNIFNNMLVNADQNAAASVQQFRQQTQVQQTHSNNAYNFQLQKNNFINGRVLLGNSRQSTELNALSVDK